MSGLVVAADGAVRVITLDRPDHRNATDAVLHAALADIWPAIERDVDARAVVITGAGDAFCGGGDLEWIQRLSVDDEERRRVLREARAIVTGMVACPLPVIAAVNGPAVGLGFSIAALCDLVYVAEDSYFADPHVVLGLAAADGAAFVLPHLTSLMRVKELLFTGERISASDAVAAGLATRSLPREEVVATAIGVAQRLAALPTRACQETKRALNRAVVASVAASLDHLLAAESECFTSDEHAAALARLTSGGRETGSPRPSPPRPR